MPLPPTPPPRLIRWPVRPVTDDRLREASLEGVFARIARLQCLPVEYLTMLECSFSLDVVDCLVCHVRACHIKHLVWVGVGKVNE